MPTETSTETQVALVTGAARGIGLAIAHRLLEDGFHVVMVDRNAAQVEQAAQTLSQRQLPAEGHGIDVTDRPAVAGLIARLDRLDVLVNNAAIFWDGHFETATEEDFTRMFEVNVVGSFIAAQEAVKRLQRNGRIINIASRAFLAGRAHAAYTASKSAVVGLTRAMAVDLASRGIYVNCIAPGLIETEMFRSLTADRQKELIALQPTNTVGQPEDIANAVAFFASPRTQYLTGQVMIVDGGRSLGVSTY
jgi:3-oxoacyl-[acyl-carrier protein] reductase